MAKNIVICSDGTGNSTISGRGTNVFKLFEAVDLNGHRWDPHRTPQVAFYDDGVGSESFKPLRLLGGAAGWGLSENIRQLYKELVRIYDPGDQIYVFGFSRGAFTVRSLVGLIATCGLVDASKCKTADDLDKTVKKAYAAYRQCYRTRLGKMFLGDSGREAGKRFSALHSIKEETRVRFIGVWDTVDAVGMPFHIADVINSTVYRFKFPDAYLSDRVDKACHAICIDDQRHSFQPLVWNESRNGDRIEQVWFAGVHSNVGGGYPKQGLSLIALDWMMTKAVENGLRFNTEDCELYRAHQSVDDKLYDSRAGLGTFYRWKPRDITGICEAFKMAPRVHISAIERVAHGVDNYAPANLPATVTLVTTPPARGQDPKLNEKRTSNVGAVLDRSREPRGALIQSLRGIVGVGRVSYYLFLAGCLGLFFTVVAGTAEGTGPLRVAISAGKLLASTVTSPIDTAVMTAKVMPHQPAGSIISLLLLLMSSIFSRATDKIISNTASAFWYGHQQELRDALKAARTESRAPTA